MGDDLDLRVSQVHAATLRRSLTLCRTPLTRSSAARPPPPVQVQPNFAKQPLAEPPVSSAPAGLGLVGTCGGAGADDPLERPAASLPLSQAWVSSVRVR